jgi:hypothetical protein
MAVLGYTFIEFPQLLSLHDDIVKAISMNAVDLKSLHHTDPLFRYQVMSHSILLYGKLYDYHTLKAFAFRDYIDSQDLFRLKEILIQRRLDSLKNGHERNR